jgi:hypothetical protein
MGRFSLYTYLCPVVFSVTELPPSPPFVSLHTMTDDTKKDGDVTPHYDRSGGQPLSSSELESFLKSTRRKFSIDEAV